MAVKTESLATERLSPRYTAIDSWEAGDILDALIEGQLAAVAAVQAARDALEAAAIAIEGRLRDGGRLVYATCSLEPEENDEVARAFLAERPYVSAHEAERTLTTHRRW